MLIGHEKIVEDLKQLADGGRLAHGYIFFGPAMVGKRTAALSFANYLEKREFAEPFDGARGRPKILNDCLTISPDEKGVVGIDAVRQIKEFLWQKPNASPRRTLILDGAEVLTTEAQNALLKITEEPPPSSLIILITSDADGISPTILSRLQKIYFSAARAGLIEEWLIKNFGLSKETARGAENHSFHRPGLAAAIVQDKKFQEIMESAKKFLSLAAEKRRDFVKKLLADEEFNILKFLDALLIVLASEKLNNSAKIKKWHKFVALRHEAAYFNLNPRLQLENLFF